MFPDDEIWDEDRWEEYLREADRRTDLYMRLWDEFCRDHPPPEEDAPEAQREVWQRALHEWLAEHMGWEDDDDGPPVWIDESDDEPEDEDGEAWKAGLTEDFPEAQDVRELPVYQLAYDFGLAVIDWAETLPEEAKEAVLVDFCSNALQVGARLAGGHAMGYEPETLGGNIAVVKRGLRAANRALAALQQLRGAPYLAEADYLRLYERAYEVRNAVALHVQHLRERFERGLG